MPGTRFDRIGRNPALYPGVAEALGPGFRWHTHAGSARSSQAFCLSAWVPLAGLHVRHAIVEELLAPVFGADPEPAATAAAAPGAEAAGGMATEIPNAGGAGAGSAAPEGTSARGMATFAAAAPAVPVLPPRPDRHWSITVEVMRPDLLSESGGQPTSIDVLLAADDAVVCVESKYLGDAQQGFGRCSQFPAACRGFRGPGSDLKTATAAWCRLEAPEGRRRARRYWTVAERLFGAQALSEQQLGDTCALRTHSQLARTLLFAAACAQRDGRPFFAALTLVPAAAAEVVERQTAAFAADTLSPGHAGRVAVLHYERLVGLFEASGDPRAASVGTFLAARLPAAPAAPPRTETVRELRRRAEAERRARRRDRSS